MLSHIFLITSFMVLLVTSQNSQFQKQWKEFQDTFANVLSKVEIDCGNNNSNITSAKDKQEIAITIVEDESIACIQQEAQIFMTMTYNNVIISKDGTVALSNLRSGIPLKPKHVEALRSIIASPSCKYLQRAIRCIPIPFQESYVLECPRRRIFQKFIEFVQVVSTILCKNNGDYLADLGEFVITPCGQLFYANTMECLNQPNVFRKGKQLAATTPELCDSIVAAHKCFSKAPKLWTHKSQTETTCDSEKALLIKSEILGDIQHWISTDCHVSIGTALGVGSSSQSFYLLTIFIGVLLAD